MRSASSSASRIAACVRAMRASSAASGSSIKEREISPRRMYASCCDLEQLARRAAQHPGTPRRHHDGIAEYDVAGIGMISVGMHDERHAGNELGLDVFEQVRLRIAEQAEA